MKFVVLTPYATGTTEMPGIYPGILATYRMGTIEEITLPLDSLIFLIYKIEMKKVSCTDLG